MNISSYDKKQSAILPILSFISTLALQVLYDHAHFISNEGELQTEKLSFGQRQQLTSSLQV